MVDHPCSCPSASSARETVAAEQPIARRSGSWRFALPSRRGSHGSGKSTSTMTVPGCETTSTSSCGSSRSSSSTAPETTRRTEPKVCDYPDSYYYAGVKASCMCRCAGDSPWSQEVRGCLRCLCDKGVDPDLAHQACYDEATNRGYSKPIAAIALCALTCEHSISISFDITDWQVWGWR
jgi:hypothetical protein